MSSSMFASIGSSNLWGYSPSFDCSEYLSRSDRADEILTVLLINPGDIRHILHTVAMNQRKSSNKYVIHFYIFENDAETICRELLLLEVAIDTNAPVRQRANTFLEIYGNCKVQERTSAYISLLGQNLSKLVTNNTCFLKEVVDLSCLKYRQKDILELVFKSYSITNDGYDIDKLRDHRQRGYYAERYDNRKEIADWDYHYSLKGTSADIIHIRQFKDWRMNGIAFEFGDQHYTVPNRTMMAYAEAFMKAGKDQGMKKEVKGFWGDIVSSPYYSFGIDSIVKNDGFTEGLFEIVNKDTGTEQHRHHTVEVALHSMFCILWELETSQPYIMTKANDIFSGFGSSPIPTSLVQIEELNDESELGVITTEEDVASSTDAVDIEDVGSSNSSADLIKTSFESIKVVPIFGTFNDEMGKTKFENLFDFVFLSCRSAHILDSQILKGLIKPSGRVVVETAKHLVHLTNSQKKDFASKVDSYATKQSFTKVMPSIKLRLRDEKDVMDSLVLYQKSS